VGRTHLKWNASAAELSDLQFLPTMITDVTLTSVDRRIVIDAKYYREALQTYYESQTVHSENLYQLLAYLRASSFGTSAAQTTEGMLIYPVGERSVDLDYRIDDYPVRIYTLNLGQPWFEIESDLLELVA
jgi:5-methylcytosine-specific restriction enzyme subunit McrC